ncbi:gamma-glutamyl-gamma-aminobutyrate hydrolase family protein [uncultured Dubosiella sp.]|uniref:gamma-glutamyl-gamma-aminobutyrate hydrolase family protein n=1 Tax=uncultured Dubosiella sp. TaxID=1937011 RepID=UPI00261620BB|nr:gamma-glutamyl-gamma-aminobutyrate hydrolase family protein [uncultured Dubosiella sp.]
MKPVIGIAAQILKDTTDQFVGQEYIRLNEDYIRAVTKAGGIPLVLADLPCEDLKVLLLKCDGLILSGGWDIDPLLFGENEHPKLGRINRKNDDFFLDALHIAQDRRLPVLGICKGHQLLNVAYGGTLYQDLESQKEGAFRHVQTGERADYSHSVRIKADSWLSDLYPERMDVNSFHHQAIKDLGNGLRSAAQADDGVIEAIEHEKELVFGVQWHPEMLLSRNEDKALALMKKFVQCCAKNKN